MEFLSTIVLLLGISSHKLAQASGNTDSWKIQDDLTKLNATCHPYDSCADARKGDSLLKFSCQCSATCIQLGTCCVDSAYGAAQPPKIRPACRSLYESQITYYMVDRCPPSENKDSIWDGLCEENWNGDDDVMKLVPVTSLYSLITYKNYFCFRCHERTDDYLYWNMQLESNEEFDESIDRSKVTVQYDPYNEIFLAPLGSGGALIPVSLTITIPNDILSLPVRCKPDLISQCADGWRDKDVSDMCKSYMGIVYVSRDGQSVKYKNPHCALCNSEDLSKMSCEDKSLGVSAFGVKVPFSFTHLLDVNQSDGDKVGKTQKCTGNFLWDPYARKCRKMTCALPGYEVRNERCTPP